MLGRSLNCERHLVGAYRSGKNIEGAFPHGGEGDVFRAGLAQHDHETVAPVLPMPPEKRQPVHRGRPKIAQDDVRLLRTCPQQCTIGVRLFRDLVPGLLEEEPQRLTKPRIFTHDQDAHDLLGTGLIVPEPSKLHRL